MVVTSLKGKKTEDEIRQRVMEEILRAQQADNAQPQAEAPAAEPAPAEEPTVQSDEPKE